MKGRLDIVKVLIRYGARVDSQNKDGWNCLHLAAKEGHLEVTMFLHNLSPTLCLTPSKSGRLPIHIAASLNHPELVFHLLTTSSNKRSFLLTSVDHGGTDLLQNAVISGNLEMVKKLIEDYGCDVNHKDKLGRSAIHHASMVGNVDMIKLLIGFG
ncbi:1975_t:CDS:2, partial [Acaulospora morrowiae]